MMREPTFQSAILREPTHLTRITSSIGEVISTVNKAAKTR
jgi:hypothetical protein